MTGATHRVRLDDPDVIAEQYRDPTRLSARQGIWAFRRPAIDFVAWALAQVDIAGNETVLDVGCGSGRYLAVLVETRHRGLLVGVDTSKGMLAVIPPPARKIVGDAQALPVGDSVADLTLAMHMLYHVADKRVAVGELRRVTRQGGRLMVALPDRESLIELHKLIDDCARRAGAQISPHDPGIGLGEATVLLEPLFATVRRVDVPGELYVTDCRPVLDYVASLSRVARATRTQRQRDRLLQLIHEEVTTKIAHDGSLRLTAAGGCLICT